MKESFQKRQAKRLPDLYEKVNKTFKIIIFYNYWYKQK